MTLQSKYYPVTVFEEPMIAPCGMNCGSCMAYLRIKNHCPSCRTQEDTRPGYCIRCIIIHCDLLAETSSKFCYECPKFPCPRLKSLDKRYRTKYSTRLLENLAIIQEQGMEHFMALEMERKTCPQCGFVLTVHRPHCLLCGFIWQEL